jgi:hypothetical protein
VAREELAQAGRASSAAAKERERQPYELEVGFEGCGEVSGEQLRVRGIDIQLASPATVRDHAPSWIAQGLVVVPALIHEKDGGTREARDE